MRDISGDQMGRLDEIDHRILELLRAHGRRSARSLAKEIGMSPGAVSDRVTRLEATGAIRGYHADVDPVALGYQMRVIIGLQTIQGPPLEETMAALLEIPEVLAVYVVSGQWDLVVLVQVRDHQHLRETVLGGVWGTPGFRHSETMLILDHRQKSPGVGGLSVW